MTERQIATLQWAVGAIALIAIFSLFGYTLYIKMSTASPSHAILFTSFIGVTLSTVAFLMLWGRRSKDG